MYLFQNHELLIYEMEIFMSSRRQDGTDEGCAGGELTPSLSLLYFTSRRSHVPPELLLSTTSGPYTPSHSSCGLASLGESVFRDMRGFGWEDFNGGG